MIERLNKKIILENSEEWPKKRNPEYEKFLRGWIRFSDADPLPPREIDCDIRDVIVPKYKEIKSERGEPRSLCIPNRFRPNLFNSESVYNSYRDRRRCGAYCEPFMYFGMNVLFHDGEELYIEYLPGEDMSKYIANFDT